MANVASVRKLLVTIKFLATELTPEEISDIGKVLIRAMDRLEKDIDKLNELYKQGYDETMSQMEEFKKWLKATEEMKTEFI